MSESTRMLLGLALGIIIMIVLVMKTKVHSFMALLIADMITGIIGGMPISDVTLADGTNQIGLITAIQEGFGSTLKSTGIIIGLGVMMGGILEKSGAAEKMAYSFIKAIGQKKEEWALAITGWFISIPVFADSAIVIFAPLCKAMSKVTGKSVVSLALSLAVGLQLTHCLVPPTPGPLTAAGMFNVDVGTMIIGGALISIPMLIVVVLYTKWIGKKIYQIPNDNGGFDRKEFRKEYIKSMDELNAMMDAKPLPGFWVSVLPIIVPIVLILLKTVLDFVDKGRMKMQPAVELSYLDEESQRDLVDIIDGTEVFPSFSQTVRMRKAFKDGKLTYELVEKIMAEDKANQKPKYRFSVERLGKYMPADLNDKQAEEYVLNALSYYKKHLDRKARKEIDKKQ